MAGTRTITRRRLLQAAGLGGLGLVLAACGRAAPQGGTPQASSGSSQVQLELWTFVNTHARWWRAMAEDYRKKVNPGFQLKVSEIAYQDLFDKLRIAIQSGGVGAPDIADVEQGAFGGFLRGGSPGFVDLTDRLQTEGYMDQLVASREALYSYDGKTYGIEHALCPVVLYYRADVWEAAGVDPTRFSTWEDYILGAKQVARSGVHALPFPAHDVLLRQRGEDYFDQAGKVKLDSPLSVETMEWILALKYQHGIAEETPDSDQAWWAAVKEGKFVSVVGADWYAGFLKDNVPELKGKWRAVALPAWEKGGRRTSCSGGTGACILDTSQHVEEAWKFLKHSMLSVEGNVRRYEMTNLYPPFKPAWKSPRLHVKDEYFGGQDLGELFSQLGPDVPPQYQSPFRTELNTKLEASMQAVLRRQRPAADVFRQVANEIRREMSEE